MNPAWKTRCEELKAEGNPFGLSNISTAEQIKFLAAFAARHQLSITCENRTFILRADSRHVM